MGARLRVRFQLTSSLVFVLMCKQSFILRSDRSNMGVRTPSCVRACVRVRDTVCVRACVCAPVCIHYILENQKWDFLGPRFLEMQKEASYIHIHIYVCVCVFPTLMLSLLLRWRHFGGLQVRLHSSLNLLQDAAVWSVAPLNSIEITCWFHYVRGCGRSRANVYERFRNILEEGAEKMVLT